MPSLRPFAPGDFDRWLPLWRGYQSFYKVDIPATTTAVTWRRLLDPAEPMRGVFALGDDGAPVGFVHTIDHRSCWTVGDYLYLQDLYVAESVRGRGHGRALIEHVYADAQARGIARVYWLTHESNATARALYDRVADRTGFIQYRKVFPDRAAS
ncbi:MAG: GNAT family N-acetyltransferase [Burkholderiales bacterium]|nr:GNAT family N-acetyltransferase [Burkholderiales bacterium]